MEKPWLDEAVLREFVVDKEMTHQEIADHFGTTKGAIDQSCSRRGVETPAEEQPWHDESRLRRLYEGEGLSQHQIAERFECDQSVISEWMDHHGIEVRDRSEAVILSRDVDPAVRDPALMHEMYVERGLPSTRIASLLDCDPTTVRDWLAEHGIDTSHTRNSWTTGEEAYYGPNWREKREDRLDYDDRQCVICHVDDEEHVEQYGHGLHVHHVVPLLRFADADGEIDYSQANRLENLISLCRPHHNRWEGVQLRPLIA